MAQSATNKNLLYEEKVDLALNAIQLAQVPSIRAAADLYDVNEGTLRYRKRGHVVRRDAQVNNRKLTATEEQATHQKNYFT